MVERIAKILCYQSGYVTEEECSKWPKEVCTVGRELKTKFNPVTKCEKVSSSKLR